MGKFTRALVIAASAAIVAGITSAPALAAPGASVPSGLHATNRGEPVLVLDVVCDLTSKRTGKPAGRLYGPSAGDVYANPDVYDKTCRPA